MALLRNGVIVSAAVAVVVLLAALIVHGLLGREVASPVTTLNPSGTTGTVLLVTVPGLSRFPDDITAAFADGLAAAGWRIERTTASQSAPVDLGRYDLVVLGSPVYANAAAPPLSVYITRLGRLDGKRVALIFTAAGDAGTALQASAAQLVNHGARIVGQFGYTTQQANASAESIPGTNRERAVALAREAGRTLRLTAS